MLDGDPGLGKSTVMLDIGARVSTGSPMPDGDRSLDGSAGVVLMTAEDGIADTIRPRLEAAGADLDSVHVLRSVACGGEDCPPSIPADVDAMEDLATRRDAALVVVDPLMAFLGARVDSFRDQDVRRALHALSAMAERTGVAVVVIRHLTKSGGAHALYRGGGSIGIIGAARSGLLVAPDPEDDSRRILAQTKSNLAAMPGALAYRLVPDESFDCGVVKWDGPTDLTASQLLALPESGDERSALDEAIEFLGEALGPGPLATKDLERRARDAGIAPMTLRRARQSLGCVRWKEGAPGTEGQRWGWSLPEVDQETPKLITPERGASSGIDDQVRHDEAVTNVLDTFPCSEIVAEW